MKYITLIIVALLVVISSLSAVAAPAYDLTVEGISAEYFLAPENFLGTDFKKITFGIDILNQGTDLYTESFDVKIDTFGKDGEIFSSTVFTVPAILAAKEKINFWVPQPYLDVDEALLTSDSTYEIRIMVSVDPENKVTETNEFNNRFENQAKYLPFAAPDADNDGIWDLADNCVNVANHDQKDTDSNGIGDACENNQVKTFADSFAVCEPGATTILDMMIPAKVIYKYEIVGSVSESCLVKSKYIDNPNTNWIGKEMICKLDNTKNFSLAEKEALDNIETACYGDLANLIKNPTGTVTDQDSDADGVLDSVDNCPAHPNPTQTNSDNDSLGDACDDTPGTTSTDSDSNKSANENEYDKLETKFNEIEDDYYKYKKKYKDAVSDDDEDDKDKYQEKLENDVEDELKDLIDDIENLIDDIEDEKNVDDDLLEKAEDLLDDAENLQDKVDDLLGNKKQVSTGTTSNYVAPPQKSTPTEVVIEPLQMPRNQPDTRTSSFGSVGFMAWIIGGIVILLAIVIFMIALLLR